LIWFRQFPDEDWNENFQRREFEPHHEIPDEDWFKSKNINMYQSGQKFSPLARTKMWNLYKSRSSTMMKNVYKDSFDSLIFYAKQPHKIQSSRSLEIRHAQDLRISSFHEILWTSTMRIRLCYVWNFDPLESLCSCETTPKMRFGGEKCLLFFTSSIYYHQDPWEK